MSELGYGLDEYEIWYEFYGPGSKEEYCEVHNLDEFDDIFYNEDEDIYEVNKYDEDGNEIFEEYIRSEVNENELILLNRYIKNEDGVWVEEDEDEYEDALDYGRAVSEALDLDEMKKELSKHYEVKK